MSVGRENWDGFFVAFSDYTVYKVRKSNVCISGK